MMFLGDKGGQISWSSPPLPPPFETFLSSHFHEGALYRSSPLESEETIVDEEMDESLHRPEKKRRLSSDQVGFLEQSFEVDNRLEPDRKIQLASELGLQPRQVAVWFQNRRARWKTKQLEKDLGALKSRFNSLKLDHDNLLKENQKLNAEVISLTDKLLLRKIDDRRKAGTNGGEVAGARTPPPCDLSHAGEDKKVKRFTCVKLEDSSGDYDFGLEEQGLWLWPY